MTPPQNASNGASSGKRALVTGASRGIGAAIARRLAKDGFHIFVNYSSNEAKAQEIVNQIVTDGGRAELCGFDVSQPDAVDEKNRSDRENSRPFDSTCQ